MHADSMLNAERLSGRPARPVTVIAAALLLALAPASRADLSAREVSTVLQKAAQNARDRDPARVAEAVASVSEIATNARANARFRQQAFEALIDIQARRKAYAKAIEAAESMRLAFPKNAALDREAVFAQADQYAQLPPAASNSTPAVTALQAYVQRRAADNESCAQALLRMARFHLRADAYDAARDAARAALARDPANADLGVAALWLLQDAAQRAGRPDERLRALEQTFDPKYRDALSDEALALRRNTYAETLRDLRRFEDLRHFLGDLERTDTAPVRRQQWCLALADAMRDQGLTNDSFTAYERVFTDHPDVSTCWFDAQSRIVDLLAAARQTNAFLKASHVLLDAARDWNVADRVANRMAEFLRQPGEKRNLRGDALVATVRYGPAGKTGKSGATDPLPPVLSEIGYPELDARRQAFAAASPSLGDGVDASLQRGWAAVYAGDPRQAIAHFADALRRSPTSQVEPVVKVLLQNGFRPLLGHPGGLGDISHFIAYGPSGADGKTGTEDDLPNPFAALGIPAVSAQPGGLIPLSVDEVRELQRLIVEVRELIRRSETPARQIAAVGLYQRAIEALVVVDRRETQEWIVTTMLRENDDRLLGALARLGASVARSDTLDLSASRRFYDDVVRQYEQAQRKLPGDVESARRSFDAMTRMLEKKQPGKKK